MKKKELKMLAQKIAKYEKIIQTSDDNKEIRSAQEEIMKITKSVNNLEDMVAIDEIVMTLLDN